MPMTIEGFGDGAISRRLSARAMDDHRGRPYSDASSDRDRRGRPVVGSRWQTSVGELLRAGVDDPATAPADVERFAKRFGCRVTDGFGSTEGGVTFVRLPTTPAAALGVPVADVRVID